MAHRLDREQPDDDLPEGWEAVRLGVVPQRLVQLLPVRPQREADCAADEPHHVRSCRHPEDRRAGQRALLHRARRRQFHEGAAPPRRSRRQGGNAAHRPRVQPLRRRLPGFGRRPGRVRRRRLVRHLARQQVLRGRVSDPRRPARHPAGRCHQRQACRRARAERPDEVQCARAQEGRDVHLQGGRRQDDAARPDSRFRRISTPRRNTRRSSPSTVVPPPGATPRARRS